MPKKNKKKKIGFLLGGKIDYPLLIITGVLLGVGLAILLSASTPTSVSEEGHMYKYFAKQGALALVGLVSLFFLSFVDYRIYKHFKWPIYILSVGILFLVGFTGLEEGGGRRWIRIAGFVFQPSEVTKVTFIVFYAALLSEIKENGNIRSFYHSIVIPGLFFLPIGYSIFVLQNHFSATLIIGAITIVQMFVIGCSIISQIKWLIPLTGCGIGGIAYVIHLSNMPATGDGGFRFERIRTWLHLEQADKTKEAWQIINSLYAIGSGGIFGVGLGKSKQKYLYLPEPQNDFIFAVLAEEIGFWGCAAVILLFILFIWRGIVIAIRAQDNFGTLIAIGITVLIGLQALINIAVVTNTIPVTGMPLPFFSYGGTAIISNLAAVGILLSVSKNSKQNSK